jgi:hypothetical protein
VERARVVDDECEGNGSALEARTKRSARFSSLAIVAARWWCDPHDRRSGRDSGRATYRVFIDLVFVLLASDWGGHERALLGERDEERLVRCGISRVRRGDETRASKTSARVVRKRAAARCARREYAP